MPAMPNHNVDWSCKHCGAVQLVYFGDPEDETKPDVEAVRCYSCRKLELLDEFDFRSKQCLYDQETDKPLGITDEMIEKWAYIEDGFPKP